MSLLAKYCGTLMSFCESPIKKLERDRVKVTASDVQRIKKEVADYFESWLDKTERRSEFEQLIQRDRLLRQAPCPYGTSIFRWKNSRDVVDIEMYLFGYWVSDRNQSELGRVFNFLKDVEASEKRTRHMPKALIQAGRFIDGVLEDIEWSLCPSFAL